jgi:predicted short-subunit dehydrogenase-like oxidoreductase (DUF2520 family)
MKIVIVGAGRCGLSLAAAAENVGHDVTVLHHDEVDQTPVADAVVVCVPDSAIASVAAALPPTSAVVMHVAGSRGLDVLQPHPRVASMHPLMALPNAEIGSQRLRGATFAVAGDPLATELVTSLGGRPVTIHDDNRVNYHAAACVAANHLVALMASVDEIARSVGLSVDDYLPLAIASLRDVAEMGPRDALTGPASRGDLSTIDAHLHSIPASTRELYVSLAREALALGELQRSTTVA